MLLFNGAPIPQVATGTQDAMEHGGAFEEKSP